MFRAGFVYNDLNKFMYTYLFYGVILPERAQISLNFDLGFSHLTSGEEGRAKISIVLNQLSVTVVTEVTWNIHDLRNVVKSILQNELAMIGYLKGYAYEFEITRVLNPSQDIDYVFGIDIPCIAKPRESTNLEAEREKLKLKTIGRDGVYINRCLSDLVSAMKHADDTGFYCFRAIESLRLHCASIHSIDIDNKKAQWKKFNEVSGLSESETKVVTEAAKPVRHGDVARLSGNEREELLKKTWVIVESYLNNI
jgi:hypothetical protein